MAKRQIPYWGDRRWKLFETEYTNKTTFSSRVNEIAQENDGLNKIAHIAELLTVNNLPSDLLSAVYEYTLNPNMDREHYIRFIPPPAQFWSTSENKSGPHAKLPANRKTARPNAAAKLTFTGISKPNVVTPDMADTAEDYLNLILNNKDIQLNVNGSEVNGLELGHMLSDGNLMLRINPYTTKEELKDFIDFYWDELKPLIDSNKGDAQFSQKLVGNIRRSKDDDETKREQLIMKLTEDKESDLYIQTQLGLKGFGYVTFENIRQIRYRFKKRNEE